MLGIAGVRTLICELAGAPRIVFAVERWKAAPAARGAVRESFIDRAVLLEQPFTTGTPS
jgi:hypothetical protein